MSDYYELDPKHTDSKRVKKERDQARNLKQSPWWKEKLSKGLCHYCEKKFSAKELTMDHLVPIARGGISSKNNLVPACKPCNSSKKLAIPVEDIFRQLEQEKLNRSK